MRWAVIAQFFYVGAQVCVTSSFIRAAQQGAGFDERTAGIYLFIYGILFTVGRFVGTALLAYVKSPKLLSIYACVAIVLCLIAITVKGPIVVYALGGLGFSCRSCFQQYLHWALKVLVTIPNQVPHG